MPHISIKPEVLFDLLGIQVTNSFITSFIVTILLSVIAIFYTSQSKKPYNKRSLVFYTLHGLIKQIYILFSSVVGDKIHIIFPLLISFFLFILLQNWFGLLPGVGSILYHHIPLFRGGTADLNTTLALGILAVLAIQYFGVRFLGLKQYLGKFFNLSGPLYFFIGILEIVSEFSRMFSFSFRLFGNIIAGEILLVIIAGLIPVVASFPFLIMEIFVGLIQAVVFSTLAAIFIKMAITSHH